MGLWHKLVVLFGAWAEFALPVLILIGLLTRLAALGMVGFVLIQSLTDVIGHGAAWGAWFDRASDAVILDQRAFWMLLFLVLILKGAGPISVDLLLRDRVARLAT
jgi:putative oxidoreductase